MSPLPLPGKTAAIRTLVEAPRWLFLAALVFAPWAYGCTPVWAISCLELILGIVLVLWLAGAAVRRLPPRVDPVLRACVLLLLGFGSWMALNPHLHSRGNYYFDPVRPLVSWLPGSVDGPSSWWMVLRVACLLGAACFVCDLSARRVWRRRVWRTMAGTGVSLILFGLIQSAFARPILVWNREDITVPYFATYYYHGNAGSFILLVLPLVAGLGSLALRKPDATIARTLWFPGFFMCLAGAFVNVSRSAMVITVLLCVLLLIWQFYGEPCNDILPSNRLQLFYVLLMAAAVVCLVAFSGWQRPAEKWSQLHEQLNSSNKRLIATQVCLRMFKDAHWHGFGPGTFSLVFPHYTGSQANLIMGVWRYAHDDYLQAILEWGWLFSIPLGVIYFGALVILLKQWRIGSRFGLADRVLIFTSALSLGAVALHAFVDFPFQIASLQLYLCVCIGFAWGCKHWERALPAR